MLRDLPVPAKEGPPSKKSKNNVADAQDKLRSIGEGALARHLYPQTGQHHRHTSLVYTHTLSEVLAGDSKKDKSYQPPHRRGDKEEDTHAEDPLFGSDGEEYVAPSSASEAEDSSGEGGGATGQHGRKVSTSCTYTYTMY